MCKLPKSVLTEDLTVKYARETQVFTVAMFVYLNSWYVRDRENNQYCKKSAYELIPLMMPFFSGCYECLTSFHCSMYLRTRLALSLRS